MACALDRFDFRIGELVLSALIHPQAQVIGGDLYPIGPNAPDAGDRPLANRDGEADGIGVIRHAWLTGPFAAAACGGRALKEPRGPNDLTTSMGIPDERSSKEYEDILKKIVDTSEKYKIPVMIHHANLKESSFSIKLGSRFVLHGSDVSLLNQKISEDFKKLKEAI